jgi:hypothetical protein
MPQPVPVAVREVFAALPASVQELVLAARDLMLASLPDAIEIPDAKAHLVGYGYGTRYKDIVATLIVGKTGVKMGLVQGAALPDPAGLLQGAGKVHRHVDIRTAAELGRPEMAALLEAALAAWRLRSRPGV